MWLTFSFFIIYLLFFLINIWILWNDILYRKIPNIFLGFLLILLPIWWYLIPWSTFQLLTLLFISWWFLVGGVFLGHNSDFLGSWDIKYISILILFLGSYSFPIFVGNIGVMTVCTLVFWWPILLGYCYALRWFIGVKLRKILFPHIKKNTLFKSFLFLIWNWVIIGFFLSLVIKYISIQVFEIIPSNGDFYFILSLLILLMRPGLRYILIKWQYRIFPIFGMLIFFWIYIQKNNWEIFIQEIYWYIVNIWKYALWLTLLQVFSTKTFLFFDALIEKMGKTEAKNIFHTIPYSVIIFGWFISLYFFNLNFILIIKNLWNS